MNEQLEMEKIINNLDYVPTLLLHSCCAPCSSYVLETLSNYFKITIYYYNPNIYPMDEYIKRKEEEKRFISEFKTKYPVSFLDCDYDNDKFNNMAKGLENLKEGDKRCYLCYSLRMKETALKAKELNFDYFTTTLSISPYKNSKWINEIGRNLEKEIGIKFLPNDFKKKNGYKRSIELSSIYGLYRQDYCGCVYSKVEREKYLNNRIIVDTVVVGELLENCYIISKGDDCLIVDPGSEFDKIREKVGNKKVLGVLITHHHFDHVGALKQVLEYYKVNTFDFNNLVENTYTIGPFTFNVINNPGHTSDSISFYFKNNNIMFTGDFIFLNSIGRCDLDDGNYQEMENSITKFKILDNDFTIYPGHGDKTTYFAEIKNNPYL